MKIFKICVDIAMFIVTFILMNLGITGQTMHEILGIILATILVIHIITNFRWIKSITKNFKKVNIKFKILYIVSVLIMIVYFGTIIVGILISQRLFKTRLGSNYKLVLTHIILGRLTIPIMLIHIGLNLSTIFKFITNKKIKIALYIIYIIISCILSIYSIYKLTHSFEWISVFG